MAEFLAPVTLVLLEWALYYANLGWRVLPLGEGSDAKKPRIRAWQDDATEDVATITAWWSDWPNAGIGLATGEGSGFDVLDVDGDVGAASLAELVARHDLLLETMEVSTGRGRHLYFQHHPGLRNSAGKLAPGLDVRGDGGYVVAPPTLHPSGTRYTVGGSVVKVQDWPAPLIALLQGPPARERGPFLGGSRRSDGAIAEGERDDTFWREACRMRKGRVPIDEALVTMESLWQSAEPGQAQYPLEDALEKVTRAYDTYPEGGGRAPSGPDKDSQSLLILETIHDNYVIGRSTEDEAFLVPNSGPRVARLLINSRLRGDIAFTFFQRFRKPASATAMKDALAVVAGESATCPRTDLPLRVAGTLDRVVIDLGTSDGSAVVIEPGVWATTSDHDEVFRRTNLSAEMPAPAEHRGLGGLERLKALLNVSAPDWPLLIAWLIAAFLPGLPWRQERGWTQKEVGQLVERAGTTISNWERGRCQPKPLAAKRLIAHIARYQLELHDAPQERA